MIIGVISDTHDRVNAIEKSVEIFNAKGVDAVLHCGDFVAPFALAPFKKLKAPFYAVFGNNDGEKEGLFKLFDEAGWSLKPRPWLFELDGTRIAMLHEPAPIAEIVRDERADLIVFGHTHEALCEERNGIMIVNPGEGCGWVKKRSTLATVDLASRTAQIESIFPEGEHIK